MMHSIGSFNVDGAFCLQIYLGTVGPMSFFLKQYSKDSDINTLLSYFYDKLHFQKLDSPKYCCKKRIYQNFFHVLTLWRGSAARIPLCFFSSGKLWPSGQPFVAGLQHLRKEQGWWMIFTRRRRRLDVEQSGSEHRLVELKNVFVCSPLCPMWYLATGCWHKSSAN